VVIVIDIPPEASQNHDVNQDSQGSEWGFTKQPLEAPGAFYRSALAGAGRNIFI
jgi:hypothetical protein